MTADVAHVCLIVALFGFFLCHCSGQNKKVNWILDADIRNFFGQLAKTG